MPQRSLVASLASLLGAIALILLAAGVAGIHMGLLSPIAGFQIAGLGGLLGGLLAIVCGALGILRTRATTGLAGRGRAVRGLLLGGASVALLLGPALGSGGAPPIHDITTDIDDPPSFSAAVRDAPDRMNGVDYPDGDESVPDQQRAAFPDLSSIDVAAPPPETFRRSLDAARSLGWEVSRQDVTGGRIEAQHTSRVFRFVDDVVIRIRPAPDGGSRVDLRSNSRVGGGDLGANAARIRAFRDILTGETH